MKRPCLTTQLDTQRHFKRSWNNIINTPTREGHRNLQPTMPDLTEGRGALDVCWHIADKNLLTDHNISAKPVRGSNCRRLMTTSSPFVIICIYGNKTPGTCFLRRRARMLRASHAIPTSKLYTSAPNGFRTEGENADAPRIYLYALFYASSPFHVAVSSPWPKIPRRQEYAHTLHAGPLPMLHVTEAAREFLNRYLLLY